MIIDHLDDVALSAAIDGEATAEEQEHLAMCTACQQRAGAFRAVARAVATPVTPRSAVAVSTAVEAALAGAAGRAAGSPAGQGFTSAGGSFLRTRKAGAGGQGEPAQSRRLLAAAAVIVAVLGAAGVVGLLGRSSSRTSAKVSVGANRTPTIQAGPTSGSGTASAPGSGRAGANGPAASRGGEGSAAAAAPAVPPDVGPDLGAQQDPAVVGRLVDSQITSSPSASAPTPSVSGRAAAAAVPCTAQGATAAGITGPQPPLRYSATLRWKGVDAMVLVYDRQAGGLAGVVVRRSDCAQLAALPV